MRGIAATAAILAALGSASQASLTGSVLTPDGSPVAGISVTQKSTGLSAVTDARGVYTIDGATGIGSTATSFAAAIRNGRAVLHLPSPDRVTVTVHDLRGHVLSHRTLSLNAGTWELPSDSRGGVNLIEISSASGYRASLRLLAPAGVGDGAVTALGGTATAARLSATADSLTLANGKTVIGSVGISMTSGTAPDISIVRRVFSGSLSSTDTAYTKSAGNAKLLIVSSAGTAETVSLNYGTAFADTLAWKLVDTTHWTALLRVYDGAGAVIGSSVTKSFADSAQNVSFAAFPLIPDSLKYSVDWVWEHRVKDDSEANALNFYNYIFDQIIAEGGSLNYCVRWESKTKITKENRLKFEPMLNRAIGHWIAQVRGYDGFPYDTIPVKITGWAVISTDYLDTTGIGVPVYVNGGLESAGATAPHCPDVCDRDNFHSTGKVTTNYPNCTSPDTHFDMSLWRTDGMSGGAGGDWGQREGSNYILSILDLEEPHIIEHEMGHGNGLPDFYTDSTDCPGGNCANLPLTIMNAGASMVITPWDSWSIRRVWSEFRAQGRWPGI